MQTEKTNSDTLFPPIPDSYHDRMERVLDALPAVSHSRTTRPSIRPLSKKQLLILIAALIVLLTASTALAVGLSQMEQLREQAQQTVSEYQSLLDGTATEAPASAAATSSVYFPMNVGTTDTDGAWLPEEIYDPGATTELAGATLRLLWLETHNDHSMYVEFSVETEHPEAYIVEELLLSINGGEPFEDEETQRRKNPSLPPDPYVPHASTPPDNAFDEDTKTYELWFDCGENPLRNGNTLTFSGRISGETFTLTYAIDEAEWTRLKQEKADVLSAYSLVLSEIPDEVIPVGATAYGYTITELAIRDHWLYYVQESEPTFWQTHSSRDMSKLYPGSPDLGFYCVIDGMMSNNQFISSRENADGAVKTNLYRTYLPYPDALPKESLLSFGGCVFRMNWETRTATVPRDEEEYRAWHAESDELIRATGNYDTDRIAKPNAGCSAFTVTDIMFTGEFFPGQLSIVLQTDESVPDAQVGTERQPIVVIDGLTLEQLHSDTDHPNRFDGGSENADKRNGFIFHTPALAALPDAFMITVTWRNETVSIPLRRSDFAAVPHSYETYGKLFDW